MLFDDNKEAETEEEVGADVVGMKRRNRKRLNNVQAIEGLITTVEKKMRKTMEVRKKLVLKHTTKEELKSWSYSH